jgi:hypothetical protein
MNRRGDSVLYTQNTKLLLEIQDAEDMTIVLQMMVEGMKASAVAINTYIGKTRSCQNIAESFIKIWIFSQSHIKVKCGALFIEMVTSLLA